jgi:general secretion pathway protein G
MANLKQIGMAVEMYTQDCDEIYPFAKDVADANVPQQWDMYPQWQAWIPYMPFVEDVLNPYVRSYELWHCPADKGFDELEDSGYTLDGRPTSFSKLGSSYFYRTEIGFRLTTIGNMVDPTRTNLFFDGHGSWHGHGLIRHEKRWNILYCDGHVRSANVRQFDEAWSTPIVEE